MRHLDRALAVCALLALSWLCVFAGQRAPGVPGPTAAGAGNTDPDPTQAGTPRAKPSGPAAGLQLRPDPDPDPEEEVRRAR